MLNKGQLDGLQRCLGDSPVGLSGVQDDSAAQTLEGGAGGRGGETGGDLTAKWLVCLNLCK